MRAALLLLLVLAPSAHAVIEPCGDKVKCTPPATWTDTVAPVPFNAPVKFARSYVKQGITHWVWVKVAEPPRPCNAADIAKGPEYARACRVKIGETLFQCQAWRDVVRR